MKPKKLLALILALSLALSLVPAWEAAAADIDSGLVLYYSFDSDRGEPQTITDDSGKGYNGEVLVGEGRAEGFMGQNYRNAISVQSGVARFPGSETEVQYPWGETATSFAHGAAIKIPHGFKDELPDSYTVSMWIKADTGYSLHDQLQRLFDFGSDYYDSAFLRYSNNGLFRFQDRRVSNDANAYVEETSDAAEGKWAMATAVFDTAANTASVYVNGKLLVEEKKNFKTISSLSEAKNGRALFIGRTQWWDDRKTETQKLNPDFGGWMDEVRVYSRALTAEDVDALYGATYRAPDMQLITSGTDISFNVKQGESPELPTALGVTMEDGTTKTASVIWDEVPEERLVEVGQFTVRGTVTLDDGTGYGKIAAANITVNSADSSLGEGLVLYYSFDNDSNSPTQITDASGNSLTGQVISGGSQGGPGGWPGWSEPTSALTVQSATRGKVANFPGGTARGNNNYTNGPALSIPAGMTSYLQDGSFTVSMWVKPDGSYSMSGYRQRFFDFGDGEKSSVYLRYIASDGEIMFWDRDIGEDSGAKLNFHRSLNDSWNLVTVTNERGGDTVIYINGEEAARTDQFKDVDMVGHMGTPSGNYGFYLGRTQWWNDATLSTRRDNPEYRGFMDEVRIYDRAISESEIKELYATTCPEPMTEVAIRHELEDGTLIHSETVTLSEGSAYTYDAPATVEHDGVTYNLYRDKSKLHIDAVGSANNTITAVYTVKTYTGYSVDGVDAYINTKPQLPSTVELQYSNGDTEQADAEWLDVPENGWSTPDTYTVKGTAGGRDVEITVDVYSITGTDLDDTFIVDFGMKPELPAVVLVYTSNNRTLTSTVMWDALPENKIRNNEDFTATGRLADYPDFKVQTEVQFMFRGNGSVEVVADAYINEDAALESYGGSEDLQLTSTAGSGHAQYDRYVLLRFPKVGMNVIDAKLRLYMNKINNNADTDYSLYSFDGVGENLGLWDENQIRYADWVELYESSLSPDPIASASFSPSYDQQDVNDWIEFDITDFVNENAAYDDGEYFNFYLEASTCATYFSSREGAEPPVIEYTIDGNIKPVNYVAEDGEVVSAELTPATNSGPFSYYGQPFAEGGKIYVPTDHFFAENIADHDAIEIPVAAITETIEIRPLPEMTVYTDEAVVLPAEVTVSWNSESFASSGSLEVPVTFEETDFASAGVYDVAGDAAGFTVEQRVKAYEPYYNTSGSRSGYGSVIYHLYKNAVGETIADRGKIVVRQGSEYSGAGEYLNYYPQIKDPAVTSYSDYSDNYVDRPFKPFIASEPVYSVTVQGELTDGVSGRTEAALSYGDDDSYTLSIGAVAANTADEKGDARLIVVSFENDLPAKVLYNEPVSLPASMKDRTELEPYVLEGYTYGDDIRAYLWQGDNLRPLTDVVFASELPEPSLSEEVLALIPKYDDVKENVLRANDYRQRTWSYNMQVNGIDLAFWDTATYHTGNMETYFTFGGDNYLQYSLNWADTNGWQGNNYSGGKDGWTWGYNQNQGSNAVLFGDWQICFQTYIDLYMLDEDKNEGKVDRAKDVMSYQITKTNDDFWWWADALYMVPPVMTKMYLLTGNEEYLEKMYQYYRFAAELMYDGDCGIPNDGEEYTTSAENNKKSGAAPSDPDNYANLFFRDNNYVYPLNTINGTKNFWARGNGWVFAGLAKILSDVPTDYEHRGYFENLYLEMAKAIIDCQHVDGEGRGFWTQSMLADYPKGNNGNSWGYETSGTAFFTYGLFWGLNSGLLDEREYLEPALRGWKYLSEVALQDSGKVGYCQEIGSNATQATPDWRDQPFGYGAFLLAGCELSRYVGGVTENNAAYLKRKLWGGSAASDAGKYYKDGAVTEGAPLMTDDSGELWIPLDGLAPLLGGSYSDSGSGTVLVGFGNESRTVSGSDLKEEGGVKYLRGSIATELSGKYASSYGGVTVFSHKAADDLFYDCDEKTIEYLQSLLG